ncbi:uncharacterized protein LOC130677502 [Microplitis mediator]|uniref:uncharacterized protein LOC130677502 n=1 Tax=Microplitis mediator TaxID=375433 RepID=UPI0025563C8D|nr:uncharacterized protein LOC130677502 [Microplitis mediator]
MIGNIRTTMNCFCYIIMAEIRNFFLVYTMQRNRNYLTSCSQWLGDGTFRTAPAILIQFYVLHGLKYKTLPLVYLIALNKSKTIYIQFLKLLRERIPNYLPDRLMINFEPAFIEYFKNVYSGTQICGYNFHFSKCVYKHVQQYGLQNQYNNDMKFLMIVRLMALAFVPTQDVVAAFEEIVSSDYYERHNDLFDNLLEYFEMTWVGKVKHNKTKREKPIFPSRMWNCYNAVLKDFIRSNNPCEGWNSGFNARVGQAHPSIAELVKSLKDEQNKTDILMTRIESGLDVVAGRLKAYQNYADRLKRVAQNYDPSRKLEYLNNIAKILASKSYM